MTAPRTDAVIAPRYLARFLCTGGACEDTCCITLRAQVDNRTATGVPMTLARIGIPGGLVFRTWQLEELREEASSTSVTALVPGNLGPAPHARHAAPTRPTRPSPSRLPWAELFRRVFRDDLLVCPSCTDRMRVLAAITDPAVVGAILTHLDLSTEPPPVATARAPPQVPIWPGALDPLADLDAYDPA